MVQAKLGEVNTLSPRDKNRLKEQIEKMRRLTPSPKVMEVPECGSERRPAMLSGNLVAAGQRCKSYGLGDYFVSRVLTTLDGNTDKAFVLRVKDSRLTTLHVLATRTK